MRLISFLLKLIAILVTLALAVPAAAIAGLWVWLRLTEDPDEAALDVEQERAA
jgi:hypothetical protein